MKQVIIFLLVVFHGFSCSNANSDTRVLTSKTNEKSQSEKTTETYKVDADGLLKDFMTWYNYTYYNVRLAQDFAAEDEGANQIDKTTFLNYLSGGDYIAFKAAKKDNVPVYRLYKPKHMETEIKNTMVQMAQSAMSLAAMEGKELPDYQFTDINGNAHNKQNTKGHVILLKCWYISCVACVKEFPELNELTERYKNRSDIKFISLATDSKADLISFLTKKPFSYAVVPEMGNYMTEKLNVNAYPLHLLINKEGRIVKATNSIDDMLPYFEKEAG
jgi:peroxiredoxin